MTETTTTVSVGDVFVESWGYDQTNVSFYQVTGLTPSGKSVHLQAVKQTHVDDSHVVPVKDAFVTNSYETGSDRVDKKNGKPFRKLVQQTEWRAETEPYVALTSYSSGYLWDGKPEYKTPYGQGH